MSEDECTPTHYGEREEPLPPTPEDEKEEPE